MSDQRSSTQQTAINLKLFNRTFSLTGRSAEIVLLIGLGLLVATVAYLVIEKPDSVRSALTSPLWISAFLWILMVVYWSAVTKKAAPVKSAESQASRRRHRLLLNAALLLAFVPLPGLGARWLPVSPLNPPVGLGVQVSAMLLDIWAMRCLGRNWSAAVTIKIDHQLIRTGPYRLVRHPIYTAMIGMFAGTAIVSGEIHALLAVVVCVVAYWRKIRMEEAGLREIFGKEFDDYRRVSWALIPWLF